MKNALQSAYIVLYCLVGSTLMMEIIFWAVSDFDVYAYPKHMAHLCKTKEYMHLSFMLFMNSYLFFAIAKFYALINKGVSLK